MEEYNNLPKQTGPERKRAKNLVHETARQLLQNPERIDAAASIWKSHETSQQDPNPKEKSFYELAKEESGRQTKDHWKELSSAKLTQLVKTYSYSCLVQDMAGEIIKAYFSGPSGIKQRIDSLYSFVYGLMDLALDAKALTEGLKIVRFESDILPKGSSFHKDYDLAGAEIADDDLIAKTISINNVILGLSLLCPLYTDENIQTFLEGTPEKGSTEMKRKTRVALRRFSKEQALRRANLLTQVYRSGGIMTDQKGGSAEDRAWLASLLNRKGDILRERLNRELAPICVGRSIRKQVEKEMERTVGDVDLLTIADPEGYVLSIFLPANLSQEEKTRLMKLALEKRNLSDKDRECLERTDGAPIINTSFSDNGITIRAFCRKPGVTEVDRHSVSALETIGFPVSGNDGQELAEEILRKQIRFLNRRGVRVPLDGKLKELGYTHIDFYKDANSDGILIQVFVGDVGYSVKLDKYFNFDFEGKRFDNLALSQSLRHVFLSLLRPILCEERIKTPTEEISLEEREVISRMGHLTRLPRGRRFRPSAVKYFFEYEGRDLYSANFEFIERAKGTEWEGREVTYTRPVVEKEENLPPITLHLPGVLQFLRFN